MYVHTYIVLGASTYNATLAAAKCDLRNMSHNVKLSFTVPSLMSERCVFSPPPPSPFLSVPSSPLWNRLPVEHFKALVVPFDTGPGATHSNPSALPDEYRLELKRRAE